MLDGNQSARNVLIFTEHINATYFISFDIPMRRMHAAGEVNLAVVSQAWVESHGRGCWARWVKNFCPHVVVMTRYGEPFGTEILEFLQHSDIPVIYHIDDDLLDVPDSLGAEIKERQGATGVVQTRRHLLANCNLIYASTSYLATLMRGRFPKQRVFQGIYAPYMGESIAPTQRARKNPVVGYMGSKGHQQDLELVVPALKRLLEERIDLEFDVFGTIHLPKALECFGARVRGHAVKKSYVEFLNSLASLGWHIGLAPLVDTPFNRCKAPTKYIEYTAAGIPVVASDISVYGDVMPQGGGLLAGEDWYSPISELLDDLAAREQAVEKARVYCRQAFSPTVLQNQLREIFRTLE